jgi:hypothetical protein
MVARMGSADSYREQRAGAMLRCSAAILSVIALVTGCAVDPPRQIERPREWIAIAYFRSTASGDIASIEQATFATQTECRRWVRHLANSDFWRARNVATPDCISQEAAVGTITADHEETSPRDQPDVAI